MEISLKKLESKPSILTITRTDGSTSWSKLHKGMEAHDMAHFAVETVLGFKNAFFGIIDKGFTIQDFEAPKEVRPEAVRPENLDPEALITEHLVNLLQIELMNSGWNDNLLVELRSILSENQLPFPNKLNDESLKEIRAAYHGLFNEWLILETGNSINRSFEL